MNNYLNTLSLISDSKEFKEIEYESDLGLFTGYLSNEAPLKYEITKLAQSNELFDNYILFVTDKVMKDVKKNAGNKTTIQYFTDFIIQYMSDISNQYPEIKNKLDNYGSIEDYVKQSIKIMRISNTPNEKEQWGQIINFLTENFDPDNPTYYYIDYTGGSRAASLIVSLLSHVLELFNAKIQQIIYADILKDKRRISDLTSYYNIINEYEKQSANKIDLLKNLGANISKEAEKDAKDLQIIQDTQNTNFSKDESVIKENRKKIQEKQKKNQSSDNLTKAIINDSAKQSSKVNESNAFTKLLNQKDSELIKNFKESIVGILIDHGIFYQPIQNHEKKHASKKGNAKNDSFKKRVLEKMMTSDKYYEHFNKEGKMISGVIYQLQQLMIKCQTSTSDPLQLFEELSDITKIPKMNKYFSVSASETHTQAFTDYIEKKDVRIKDEENLNLLDWYEEYHKLQNIYLSHGFPFACSGLNTTYKEVEKYYHNKVDQLLKELSALKKENEEAYKQKITQLSSIDALEETIPEKLNFHFWETRNISSDFEQTLIRRIQKVRPYRNAISHNLKRNPVEEKNIANEIRDWIKEYQQLLK